MSVEEPERTLSCLIERRRLQLTFREAATGQLSLRAARRKDRKPRSDILRIVPVESCPQRGKMQTETIHNIPGKFLGCILIEGVPPKPHRPRKAGRAVTSAPPKFAQAGSTLLVSRDRGKLGTERPTARSPGLLGNPPLKLALYSPKKGNSRFNSACPGWRPYSQTSKASAQRTEFAFS